MFPLRERGHRTTFLVTTISIAEGTLHGILAGCPALRSLVLHYNIGYRRLRIVSKTLQSLSITDGHRDREGRFEEVIVEDAPLLERLIPDGLMHDLQIRVIQAPKLKVLGHLYSRDGISTRVFKVGRRFFHVFKVQLHAGMLLLHDMALDLALIF